MNARWLVGHTLRVLLVSLMLTGALIGAAPGAASAAACGSWTGVQPPNPGPRYNELQGVAVVSPCRAWVVGGYGQPLIERWNGFSWKQQKVSTKPDSDYDLAAAAATSATDAWAVGTHSIGGGPEPALSLIEHWNGTAWTQVPSPNPGSRAEDNYLLGVAATSATSAWTVGYYANVSSHYFSQPAHTLIEHWNGTAWKYVPSPNPGGSAGDTVLSAVAATSATDAWAVGSYAHISGDLGPALIEHWNGAVWTHVPSPTPGGASILTGVAATSASNAWAVGYYYTSPGVQTLIEHWNGTAWTQVPSPNPGSHGDELRGVAATSSTSAWAVGDYYNSRPTGVGPEHTLIEHWNGTAWTHVPSPSPGPAGSVNANELRAVAASSPTNIWAVGDYYDGTEYQLMALHCC